MGIAPARVTQSNNVSNQQAPSAKKIAWVHDVILDENHEYAKTKKLNNKAIGSIIFRTSDNLSTPEKDLPIAYPFDKNFKNLPIVNEEVEIYQISAGAFAYRRIGADENPTDTAKPNAIAELFKPKKDDAQSSADYKNVETTGIVRSANEKSEYKDNFGKYYKKQEGIHKLKLYEGDSLIESRFGQSIRFSGFNNPSNKFSPTLIIRNNESADNKKKLPNVSIEEDVNKDGSVIMLSSDQYQLGFVPGVLDDKGISDFKTKPASFVDYPTKLIGDQILINSGRIILSAKNGEMIFFSKKNYGFISDGNLSIDNKLGIDISVGDDINIITNDRDVQMVTGNGSIILGSKDLEPIVKGQQLVDILSELIDAISQMSFLTPSGPSAIGSVNVSQFGTIKSKLNNILSKLNQTS
jgi:hypothetical protein